MDITPTASAAAITSAADLPDLTGRIAVVTGATSGIGRATAHALATAGAHVVYAVRDVAKGAAAAADTTTTRTGSPASTEVRALDLGDLSSVRAFAQAWEGPIDLLINNAGVSAVELARTADGFEAKFGVNHLGHFALTVLLIEHLRGRVVTVSSQAERMGRLDFDDLDWRNRPYRQSRAYNDSKLANLLFTAELQRRLTRAGSTVTAYAAHPGLVDTSIYTRTGPRRVADVLASAVVRLLAQDAAHGALPTLYAAVADLPAGSFTGPSRLAHMRGAPQLITSSAPARDAALAARLWEVSEQLTHITSPL